ncbi:MAG: phosphopentomutase [Elusimicrobia bacterium]|nr:phosphopentomutase [Elusimicrobiota bacterium]
MIKKAVLIILDSLGVGELPDAAKYGDSGSNTLRNIYLERGLDIPNLCSMGIGKITEAGCSEKPASGSYGRMMEISPGKDTTTGHWELVGLPLDFSFPTYPDGFPAEMIAEYEKRIGRKVLGNYASSGTEILKVLGSEHVKTGFPIVYTSADSVFQVAAHQDVVPLEQLYEFCSIAREMLVGDNPIARVIARPFTGPEGDFQRNNADRKDYSIAPPEDTLLDNLKNEGAFVCGVGKIGDIFAHRGLAEEIKSKDNMDCVDKTIEAMKKYRGEKGLIFVNLVAFDSVYGHRRDAEGYGRALEEFDRRLPEILEALDDDTILLMTADHGCDPTIKDHTDHTREYVPLLVAGERVKKDNNLGMDLKYSDCGQTIADILGSKKLNSGVSFREELII